MSTRYNDGSHYENHQRAAELQDLAAHAHRSAAETRDKQDHETGHERSRREHEYSQHAHEENKVGHQEIAARAHELWVERGSPEGSPDQDWFQAVQELMGHK